MIIEEGTDRLTSYGAETIEYDGMGNPKSYRGSELTWEKGRQLTKMSKADKTIQFGYDALGMRISREADGVRTEYIYEGDRLLRQITGSEVMTFIYGSEGIIGFKLGTSKYLYRKNVLGDVEEIYDESGTLVGKYSYTAFGECEIETDVNGIATKNPIRYRGYYFDEETGFYYLKTRYYDPETGRFITIDDVSYLAPDIINGLNLYAYCGNNPVMKVDPNGTDVDDINNVVSYVDIMFQMTAYIILGMARTIGRNSSYAIKASKTIQSWVKGSSSVFTGIGYVLTAVSSIQSGVEKGYSADRIVTDVVFDLVAAAAMAEIGAWVGSLIPLPVLGTLLGAAVGLLLGVLYSAFSVYMDDLKESFHDGITDIASRIGNAVNSINNFLSDGWNWLLGKMRGLFN